MKYFFLSLILTLAFININAPLCADQTESIEGIWQGKLAVQSVELRIVFKIYKDSTGNYSGTMDSPDQGAKDILLSEVTYKEKNVHIGIAAIGGTFDGKISDTPATIDGELNQNGIKMPLVLKHVDKVEEALRPQDPKKPYSYNEEEVTIENLKAGITLAGTLTSPKEGGPFPAILLITGSGPQDRDEFLMGHRPFLVLADYLTRLGFAVLRVDDRGVGKSTGDYAGATMLDFTFDAKSSLAYLTTRKEINPRKIGVIGHSEGAMIGTLLSTMSNDVAFVVNISGPGQKGKDLILLQSAMISRADGMDEKSISLQNTLQEELFNIVVFQPDSELADQQLRKALAEDYDQMSEKDKQTFGFTPEQIDAQVAALLSPWFYKFLSYNPANDLEKVKCPILVVMGDKDLQVPPKENRPLIEKALKNSGNKHYEIVELPGLNHLLQTATTGSPSEYGKIDETMSPVALKVIGDWVAKQK